MPRITLRQLLDHPAEHDYGVPAFNNNMEQAVPANSIREKYLKPDGGDGQTLQTAAAGIQHWRPGGQDQKGPDAGGDGEALCRGGTGAEAGVNP